MGTSVSAENVDAGILFLIHILSSYSYYIYSTEFADRINLFEELLIRSFFGSIHILNLIVYIHWK